LGTHNSQLTTATHQVPSSQLRNITKEKKE
jgi:hypothetical protein